LDLVAVSIAAAVMLVVAVVDVVAVVVAGLEPLLSVPLEDAPPIEVYFSASSPRDESRMNILAAGSQ
jgi:hypothetical protein